MTSSLIQHFLPRIDERSLLAGTLTPEEIHTFRAKLGRNLDRTIEQTVSLSNKKRLLWLYREFGLAPDTLVCGDDTLTLFSVPALLLNHASVDAKHRYFACLEICFRAGATVCMDAYNDGGDDDNENLLVYCLKVAGEQMGDSLPEAEMQLGMLALLLSHFHRPPSPDLPNGYTMVGEYSVWDLALKLSTGTQAGDFAAYHAVAMLLEAKIPLYSHHGVLNMVLRCVMNPMLCMRLFTRLVPLTAINTPSMYRYEDDLAEHVPDLPLVAALSRPQADCVEFAHMLLERGANANALLPIAAHQRAPPLYWAVKNSHYFESLIDLLLLHNADPTLLSLDLLTDEEHRRLEPFLPIKKRKT
jgi:hypothetical protein